MHGSFCSVYRFVSRRWPFFVCMFRRFRFCLLNFFNRVALISLLRWLFDMSSQLGSSGSSVSRHAMHQGGGSTRSKPIPPKRRRKRRRRRRRREEIKAKEGQQPPPQQQQQQQQQVNLPSLLSLLRFPRRISRTVVPADVRTLLRMKRSRNVCHG